MSNFRKRTCKEIERCDLYTGKKVDNRTTESTSREAQILGLAEKYFKVAIINMITDLKETMFQKIRGRYDDNISSNRQHQRRYHKNNQMEIQKLKNAIIKMQISLMGLNSRFGLTKETISKLKDR